MVLVAAAVALKVMMGKRRLLAGPVVTPLLCLAGAL
jgi:hypothetical protein